MESNKEILQGLSSEEVRSRQKKYGKNELVAQKKDSFFRKILRVLSEPMFLLLLGAATIYFILGEPRDGLIMIIFVVGIISIEVLQEWKTDKTLNALKDLSAPHIEVIRDGIQCTILSSDLVPGDIMLIYEGVKIPADGVVMRCNDLCINESSLTGEVEGVWKTPDTQTEKSEDYWKKDYCYAGTLVKQGTGTIYIDKIGASTEYGKIGATIAETPEASTPLQKQTRSLVRLCVGIAAALFVLVVAATWINIAEHPLAERIIESILSGITLAMAMIPEEFPVILTVFLSMGAWRLAKKNSLVRRLPSVETLGAVSVLCMDKTGTITMNQMTVTELWPTDGDESGLCEIMGLACEIDAYDPMEKAMINHCEKIGIEKHHLFRGELMSEYPFTNELKMMGHVWNYDNEIIIAAKGSPESILSICSLNEEERLHAKNSAKAMGEQGLRVIAVASCRLRDTEVIPNEITSCTLTLNGLVGLSDPPRESIKNDISICNLAGIRTVMITGDSGITASAIAKKIGMKGWDIIVTGNMIEAMDDDQLREKVKTVSIFSRVIPEHKMRIVKAFQKNGEIVAMTGDGVNDAPALKYADIGIAMGKRGSEVSREAADLILMDDNFSTIAETVKDGRRIYDNIRKAVGYVFAIHIPIAASSLLAPFLGIAPDHLLLLPLHVVLLELIVDPTCSVVLERQPSETNIMKRPPRNPNSKLLTSPLLAKSILQGVAIFLASFGSYFTLLQSDTVNAAVARSIGLVVIMLANLFLVQVNSSDYDSIVTSIKRLARDKVMWAVNIITLSGIAVILYTPLNEILKLAPLTMMQMLCTTGIAAASVLWYEAVKFLKRLNLK